MLWCNFYDAATMRHLAGFLLIDPRRALDHGLAGPVLLHASHSLRHP
jgi:hypothetical protein